jgi:hypothetical protein
MSRVFLLVVIILSVHPGQIRGDPKLLHPWLASLQGHKSLASLTNPAAPATPATAGRGDAWLIPAMALHTLAWVRHRESTLVGDVPRVVPGLIHRSS